MGCIALVRCVLVLRCGLVGVEWCGILMQAEAVLQPASGAHCICTQYTAHQTKYSWFSSHTKNVTILFRLTYGIEKKLI
jgi:hypothetical protein